MAVEISNSGGNLQWAELSSCFLINRVRRERKETPIPASATIGVKKRSK